MAEQKSVPSRKDWGGYLLRYGADDEPIRSPTAVGCTLLPRGFTADQRYAVALCDGTKLDAFFDFYYTARLEAVTFDLKSLAILAEVPLNRGYDNTSLSITTDAEGILESISDHAGKVRILRIAVPTTAPTLTPKQRNALDARAQAYVKAEKKENWKALFALVSDVGRGGVSVDAFSKAMKYSRQSGSMPDLLSFSISRVQPDSDGSYILHGCGHATREGRSFNGVASMRAVFEHGNWFFTDWSFTRFPNAPCADLNDPNWQPQSYDQPAPNKQMEELRPLPGVAIHINGGGGR